MTCDACGRPYRVARSALYKDAAVAIRDWCAPRKLPPELMDIVMAYAYPDKVTVLWQTKMRCRCRACVGGAYRDLDSGSSGFEEYSSGEDSDYCSEGGYVYGCKSANVCTACFLEGVERVMTASNSLPFLRIHAAAFFNNTPVNVDPYKYIVPKVYDVAYYRRKQPEVAADGRLAITTA